MVAVAGLIFSQTRAVVSGALNLLGAEGAGAESAFLLPLAKRQAALARAMLAVDAQKEAGGDLGHARAMLGKVDIDALPPLQKSLYASLLARTGDAEGARRLIMKAYGENPGLTDAHGRIGWEMLRRGEDVRVAAEWMGMDDELGRISRPMALCLAYAYAQAGDEPRLRRLLAARVLLRMDASEWIAAAREEGFGEIFRSHDPREHPFEDFVFLISSFFACKSEGMLARRVFRSVRLRGLPPGPLARGALCAARLGLRVQGWEADYQDADLFTGLLAQYFRALNAWDLEGALRVCDTMERVAPSQFSQLYRITPLFKQGAVNLCQEILSRLGAGEKNSAPGKYWRAFFLREQWECAGAAALLASIQPSPSLDWSYSFDLALTLCMDGRVSEALPPLEKALSLHPAPRHHPLALLHAAVSAAAGGRPIPESICDDTRAALANLTHFSGWQTSCLCVFAVCADIAAGRGGDAVRLSRRLLASRVPEPSAARAWRLRLEASPDPAVLPEAMAACLFPHQTPGSFSRSLPARLLSLLRGDCI